MQIVPAATWGRRPWGSGRPEDVPPRVPASTRTHFLVHYDGGSPVLREGASIPRAIDAEHHGKGWSGIGYNFVVDQTGTVWEGRGWDLVGAHCPGRNRDGIGVQVAIGGAQVPAQAALHAVRWLYDEASRRAGRQLVQSWHGANYSTDCPGLALIAWVRGGMTDPTAAPAADLEDDVTPDDIERIAQRTAELVTGLGARNPVLVDPGTGAGRLPDGRAIDALPTVIGEIQHEQRMQATQLAQLAGGLQAVLDAVRALATKPTT